uniref:BED-type domain-containing protein n=1 Tax=Meloidogyne incognita TaxID=6306 RepID=A0A914M328_MELIC
MSDVWKYFNKFSTEEAKCKICAQLIKRKRGNTTELWQHLKLSHKDEFDSLKCNEESSSDTQKSMLSFISKKKDRREEEEEAIARIMLRQNNSFLFFEDPDLRNLYAKANPDLPVNGWSQPTRSPQLQSVTIHWVNKDFDRKDMVLAASPMTGLRHSGDVLSEKITDCLTSNGLTLEKLVCCVRDDASNIKSAIQELEKDSFQCSCHFLNLVVNDALKTVTNVTEIINKVREWTKECRRAKVKECLSRHQEEQNLTKKQLVLSCPTRWNSVFLMLNVFKDQKMQYCRCNLNVIKCWQEFYPYRKDRVLQQMNLFPKPFHTFLTKILNFCAIYVLFYKYSIRKLKREESTASSVLPKFRRIRDFLKRHNKIPSILDDFVKCLINSINIRVEKLVRNKLLRISTLLDPRFAYDETIFSKPNWSTIEEDFIEFTKHENFQITTEQENIVLPLMDELDQNSDDSVTRYDIWQTKSPGNISSNSLDNHENKLQLKLATFRSFGRPSPDSNIFKWWKEHGQQFPDLSKFARMVHSIPATSVCSERLFSKAGLIFGNALRNRLSGELVEKILVVKANMDKLLLGPPTEPEPDESIELEDNFEENLEDI